MSFRGRPVMSDFVTGLYDDEGRPVRRPKIPGQIHDVSDIENGRENNSNHGDGPGDGGGYNDNKKDSEYSSPNHKVAKQKILRDRDRNQPSSKIWKSNHRGRRFPLQHQASANSCLEEDRIQSASYSSYRIKSRFGSSNSTSSRDLGSKSVDSSSITHSGLTTSSTADESTVRSYSPVLAGAAETTATSTGTPNPFSPYDYVSIDPILFISADQSDDSLIVDESDYFDTSSEASSIVSASDSAEAKETNRDLHPQPPLQSSLRLQPELPEVEDDSNRSTSPTHLPLRSPKEERTQSHSQHLTQPAQESDYQNYRANLIKRVSMYLQTKQEGLDQPEGGVQLKHEPAKAAENDQMQQLPAGLTVPTGRRNFPFKTSSSDQDQAHIYALTSVDGVEDFSIREKDESNNDYPTFDNNGVVPEEETNTTSLTIALETVISLSPPPSPSISNIITPPQMEGGNNCLKQSNTEHQTLSTPVKTTQYPSNIYTEARQQQTTDVSILTSGSNFLLKTSSSDQEQTKSYAQTNIDRVNDLSIPKKDESSNDYPTFDNKGVVPAEETNTTSLTMALEKLLSSPQPPSPPSISDIITPPRISVGNNCLKQSNVEQQPLSTPVKTAQYPPNIYTQGNIQATIDGVKDLNIPEKDESSNDYATFDDKGVVPEEEMNTTSLTIALETLLSSPPPSPPSNIYTQAKGRLKRSNLPKEQTEYVTKIINVFENIASPKMMGKIVMDKERKPCVTKIINAFESLPKYLSMIHANGGGEINVTNTSRQSIWKSRNTDEDGKQLVQVDRTVNAFESLPKYLSMIHANGGAGANVANTSANTSRQSILKSKNTDEDGKQLVQVDRTVNAFESLPKYLSMIHANGGAETKVTNTSRQSILKSKQTDGDGKKLIQVDRAVQNKLNRVHKGADDQQEQKVQRTVPVKKKLANPSSTSGAINSLARQLSAQLGRNEAEQTACVTQMINIFENIASPKKVGKTVVENETTVKYDDSSGTKLYANGGAETNVANASGKLILKSRNTDGDGKQLNQVGGSGQNELDRAHKETDDQKEQNVQRIVGPVEKKLADEENKPPPKERCHINAKTPLTTPAEIDVDAISSTSHLPTETPSPLFQSIVQKTQLYLERNEPGVALLKSGQDRPRAVDSETTVNDDGSSGTKLVHANGEAETNDENTSDQLTLKSRNTDEDGKKLIQVDRLVENELDRAHREDNDRKEEKVLRTVEPVEKKIMHTPFQSIIEKTQSNHNGAESDQDSCSNASTDISSSASSTSGAVNSLAEQLSTRLGRNQAGAESWKRRQDRPKYISMISPRSELTMDDSDAAHAPEQQQLQRSVQWLDSDPWGEKNTIANLDLYIHRNLFNASVEAAGNDDSCLRSNDGSTLAPALVTLKLGRNSGDANSKRHIDFGDHDDDTDNKGAVNCLQRRRYRYIGLIIIVALIVLAGLALVFCYGLTSALALDRRNGTSAKSNVPVSAKIPNPKDSPVLARPTSKPSGSDNLAPVTKPIDARPTNKSNRNDSQPLSAFDGRPVGSSGLGEVEEHEVEDREVKKLRALIVKVSASLGKAKLAGPSQHRAFQWLAASPGLANLTSGRKIQRYALATFYFSTMGANWTKNEGWLSDGDECDWFLSSTSANLSNSTGNDRICTDAGFLRRFELDSNNLDGVIPPEVGLLTDITHFSVGNNKITGKIPEQLSYLGNLEVLDLHSNALTGQIPSSLGLLRSLRELDLSSNKLRRSIPSELGTMLNLQVLKLNSNHLTGGVPDNFSRAKSLSEFRVDNNDLTLDVPNRVCTQFSVQDTVLYADCNENATSLDMVRRSPLGNVLRGSLNKNWREIDCKCCTYCCNDEKGCVEAR